MIAVLNLQIFRILWVITWHVHVSAELNINQSEQNPKGIPEFIDRLTAIRYFSFLVFQLSSDPNQSLISWVSMVVPRLT